MKSYSFAVDWIALNDDALEEDVDEIEHCISVILVADLYGKKTKEVARDVLTARLRGKPDAQKSTRLSVWFRGLTGTWIQDGKPRYVPMFQAERSARNKADNLMPGWKVQVVYPGGKIVNYFGRCGVS